MTYGVWLTFNHPSVSDGYSQLWIPNENESAIQYSSIKFSRKLSMEYVLQVTGKSN